MQDEGKIVGCSSKSLTVAGEDKLKNELGNKVKEKCREIIAVVSDEI
jgi:hypothetical protein